MNICLFMARGSLFPVASNSALELRVPNRPVFVRHPHKLDEKYRFESQKNGQKSKITRLFPYGFQFWSSNLKNYLCIREFLFNNAWSWDWKNSNFHLMSFEKYYAWTESCHQKMNFLGNLGINYCTIPYWSFWHSCLVYFPSPSRK